MMANLKKLKPGVKYSLNLRACRASKSARTTRQAISGTTIPEQRPQFGYNEAIPPGRDRQRLAAPLGADFIRVPISWANIQPTNPLTYNWAPVDAIHDELTRSGLKPLWVLSSAPCWAQPDPIYCESSNTAQAPRPLSTAPTGTWSFSSASATRLKRNAVLERAEHAEGSGCKHRAPQDDRRVLDNGQQHRCNLEQRRWQSFNQPGLAR